jgi:hypothetical protein
MKARFPDRLRLPLDLDPARLAAHMANFSKSQWIDHSVKQNNDGDWGVIPLRGPAGAVVLAQGRRDVVAVEIDRRQQQRDKISPADERDKPYHQRLVKRAR